MVQLYYMLAHHSINKIRPFLWKLFCRLFKSMSVPSSSVSAELFQVLVGPDFSSSTLSLITLCALTLGPSHLTSHHRRWSFQSDVQLSNFLSNFAVVQSLSNVAVKRMPLKRKFYCCEVYSIPHPDSFSRLGHSDCGRRGVLQVNLSPHIIIWPSSSTLTSLLTSSVAFCL